MAMRTATHFTALYLLSLYAHALMQFNAGMPAYTAIREITV